MMATTEERMKILKMIDEEKISAQEGAQLLSALSSQSQKSSATRAKAGSPRWLRVLVTDTNSGRSKATVQIPISLVDAGLKIGAHFAPELDDMDMTGVIEAFNSGMSGKIVDVVDDEDGEHVQIFIE